MVFWIKVLDSILLEGDWFVKFLKHLIEIIWVSLFVGILCVFMGIGFGLEELWILGRMSMFIYFVCDFVLCHLNCIVILDFFTDEWIIIKF